MWKLFFEYSDKSKITLTGEAKKISNTLIEHYYNFYGKSASKATYQQYPRKYHPARDFLAMYQELHMEPCPICGAKSELVQYISKEGKASYHVCCGRVPKRDDDFCELFAGYEEEETGKVKWFDSEMEAINYWNEMIRSEIDD